LGFVGVVLQKLTQTSGTQNAEMGHITRMVMCSELRSEPMAERTQFGKKKIVDISSGFSGLLPLEVGVLVDYSH
jgi:hypothetical protein